MKFFALFAAIVAVAVGNPESVTYNLQELSAALQNPETDPILIPFLEGALNEMMYALMSGEQLEYITVAMPIVNTYTVNELSAAIQDPNTHPAHIPYLESALNEIMNNLFSGVQQESITVVIPADLPMPAYAPEAPVSPELVPAPVEVPASPSASPLIQIIVNVQQQDQFQAPDVSPVIIEGIPPTPVQVAEDAPTPVEVVEVAPHPIEVGGVVPLPINPVDMIGVHA